MSINKRTLGILTTFFITFNLISPTVQAYTSITDYNMDKDIPIISSTTVTVSEAQEWAKKRNATDSFISLAPIFEIYAKQRGGVNWLVAYVQAAKETGYGKFGGVLDASYHNTCGLKVPNGGGDDEPDAHKRFDSWEQGVSAHLDHLALYAGAEGFPKTDYIEKCKPNKLAINETYDPRHIGWFSSELYGKAKTVLGLDRWATGSNYGKQLLDLYYSVVKESNSSGNAEESENKLPSQGIIDEPSKDLEVKDNILKVRGWVLNASGVKEVKIFVDGKQKAVTQTNLARPDIANIFSNYPNAANSGFQANIDISDIANGNKVVKIEAIGNDNTSYVSERTIRVNKIIEVDSKGRIDEPNDNLEVNENSLRVRGWAVAKSGVKEVKIFVDGKQKATTQTNLARPDIANAFPNYPNAANSGFQVNVDISDITNGSKVVKTEVVGNDNTIYVLENTIKINKVVEVDLKGRIDEPTDNLEVKGNEVTVRGWAVAKSGVKEIKIFVDGQERVVTNIGFNRPDVANVFPQYPNASNSGFKVNVDLSNIVNGRRLIVAKVVANDSSVYNLEKYINVNKPNLSPIGRIDEPEESSEIKSNTVTVRGWALNGVGVKEVKIFVDGKEKATTNIGLDRPDIENIYSNYPNASEAGFKANIDLSDIENGRRLIVAKVIGNDNSVHNLEKHIDVNKVILKAVGRIDEPEDGSEVKSNKVTIRGWALNGSGVKEVKVFVNGKEKAITNIGLDRPDIKDAYPNYPNASNSGFKVDIDLSDIENGRSLIVAKVVGNDNSTYSLEKIININTLKPVGRIDEPTEGTVVNSHNLTVRGWAAIASGIREVKLFVDGKYINNARVGLSRPDVANVYPQYPSSAKSGFEVELDTRNLSDGNKKIMVQVISNDGSEYKMNSSFYLQNEEDKSILGKIDDPTLNAQIYNDKLKVRGWAVHNSGIKNVRVYVNKMDKGLIKYGVSRPDVNTAYPGYPSGNNAGYEGLIDISEMPFGKLEVRVDITTKNNTIRSFSININHTEQSKKLIVLDPGHNLSWDRGNISTHGNTTYVEGDINMEISLKLKNELEKKGFTVVLTRQPGEFPTITQTRPNLQKRVELANNAEADLFISIHQNSFTSNSAHGVEVFYSSAIPGTRGLFIEETEEEITPSFFRMRMDSEKTRESRKLASNISSGISNSLGLYNRGAKDNDFYVIKHTAMPSILVECGFLSNKEEAEKIANNANQQKIAEVIAKNVANQF